MKNILKSIVLLVAAIGFTACVQDLDVTPKDPNTIMTFDQDAVFTKIYATFATTGQQGDAGNGDVDGIDEGTSAFYRMIWELNEFPADLGYWNYADPGIPDLRTISWNSSNSLVAGVYYRLMFDITLCNHFLDNTAGLGDSKTQEQIAEVRLIRAINYYYLLDMFGNVPFAETVSWDNPKQIKRADLYVWLETELTELETLLPAQRLSYYRLDKVSAEFMKMRLYLNAEVYTGTPQWNKAAEYAAKVMNSQYKLATTPTAPYTAYQKLFMADNHKNGSQVETIFAVAQDGVQVQCWGGAVFLLAAARDAGMTPWGISASWTCWRTSPEFVAMFFDGDLAKAALAQGDEYAMPALAGDDRAILCSKTDLKEWGLNGNQVGDFYECWADCKWTGIHSDGAAGSHADFPDTDIPLFRVAEAYLTYAEAVYRGATAVNGSAEDAIKALRTRANNTKAFTIDERFLLEEWAREFHMEGRRRIDLVRFGKFAGPTADYNWEGRGGANSGDAAKKIDAKFNIFPIPEADIVANPNLTQNEGY